MFDTIAQDVVFAIRIMRRQAMPAIAAALCVAVGIGATTTMFSIADALLLRPLPYPTGDRLAIVGVSREGDHQSMVVSYLDYVDWTQRQRAFASLAAFGQVDFVVQGAEPERVPGALASANLFATLGATPEAGHFFTADEDRPGGPPVILVSHGFAIRKFGSVRQALGNHIDVNGNERDIVGIVPDEARYPSRADLWVPLSRDPLDRRDKRGNRNLVVLGALRPGVTMQTARAEMRAIEGQLAREYPGEDGPYVASVVPLRDRIVGDARGSLAALVVAALLVLFVACANVAGLQLSRATARSREIAVRAALGAARHRVMRQFLTESLLLAFIGGVAGCVLATWSVGFVSRAVMVARPAWMVFDVDRTALLFSLGAASLTGIAFGLAPALRLARLRPTLSLRGGDAGATGHRAQRALVIVEITLAFALSAAAVLAVRSMGAIQRIALGFDPSGVLTAKISMDAKPYDDASARAALVQAVEARLAALPGARAAAAASLTPVDGCCSQYGARIEGDASEHDERAKPMITGTIVTPGYFRAMGIALVAGREFTPRDDQNAPLVTVISETFAKRYWPRGDALGKHVDTGLGWAEVVGIVRDIKQTSLLDVPEPQFYRSYASYPQTFMTFVVKASSGTGAALTPLVRDAVHAVAPTVPVYNVRTMAAVVEQAQATSLTFGRLLTAFAGVALLLAGAGLYAIMSFFVGERRRELALRTALGAEQSHLVRLVTRQSLVLSGLGLLAGCAAALTASRWLASILYGVEPLDPLAFVLAAVALLLITVLATFGPARRATSADPMLALRSE